MTTNNSPEALADRLEEAALASLPFGSGELAEALAEANAVRRGEEPWGDVTVSDMKVALAERDALHPADPSAWDRNAFEGASSRAGGIVAKSLAQVQRDARIARAAEVLVAASRAPIGTGGYIPRAAWDRLVEAVEGGEPGGEAEAPATGRAQEGEVGKDDFEVRLRREIDRLTVKDAVQADIRQMALDEANRIEQEPDEIPDKYDEHADVAVTALRDFAALLAKGGAE